MKTVIFSDTHLTEKFIPKKYQVLKKIINDSDHVIINGDFWDGYLTSYEKFWNSPWKKLLVRLKRKKTIYIFGNHDKELFIDKKKKFWSFCGWNYQFKEKGEKFYFEHGHRILPFWDNLFSTKPPKGLILMSRFFIKNVGLKVKRELVMTIYKKFNERLKKNFLKNKNGVISFFGHTHYPEIDLKNHYVNSGFIDQGLASYISINEAKIKFHLFNY